MALHVMDEANQCLGCKKPRCQQGGPIQTNIPEVIRLLKANKLDEAGRKAGIVRCCLCFVIKNTADVPDDAGASAVLVFAVKQKVMRVMRDDASIVPYKSGFVCCGFVMRSAAKFLCGGVRAPRPTGCFLCP